MASAAYNRRNARARALGYASYYDYRAHANGAIPPDGPRLTGPQLARARGHNSAADLIAATDPGTLITATPDLTSRKRDGTYGRIYITSIDSDGREREFLIRGAAIKSVDRLIGALGAAGAVFSPSPSLDIAGMLGDDDPDELDAWDYDDDYDDE